MFNRKISRIVIVKKSMPHRDSDIINTRAVGIITEKDISGFLFSQKPTRNIMEIEIEEVMSKEPINVTVGNEVRFCASLMLNSGISSLVVNDISGNLKGILTKSDLVRVYASYYTGRDTVKNHMSKPVHVVKKDDALNVILSVMVKNNLSRVVVVKDSRQLVGIITTSDLVRISGIADPYFDRYSQLLEEQQARGRNDRAIKDNRKPQGATSAQINRQQKLSAPVLQAACGYKSILLASDLMKYDPICITEDSDLTSAAQIMTLNGISGLPVIDDESSNNLVGIVTKTDVVRAISVLS
jgi:CBS domain-containing protein